MCARVASAASTDTTSVKMDQAEANLDGFSHNITIDSTNAARTVTAVKKEYARCDCFVASLVADIIESLRRVTALPTRSCSEASLSMLTDAFLDDVLFFASPHRCVVVLHGHQLV